MERRGSARALLREPPHPQSLRMAPHVLAPKSPSTSSLLPSSRHLGPARPWDAPHTWGPGVRAPGTLEPGDWGSLLPVPNPRVQARGPERCPRLASVLLGAPYFSRTHTARRLFAGLGIQASLHFSPQEAELRLPTPPAPRGPPAPPAKPPSVPSRGKGLHPGYLVSAQAPGRPGGAGGPRHRPRAASGSSAAPQTWRPRTAPGRGLARARPRDSALRAFRGPGPQEKSGCPGVRVPHPTAAPGVRRSSGLEPRGELGRI